MQVMKVSKWEKLLARIRHNPRSVRFDEAAKILEHMGYHRSQPKRGSSHWTFRKPGTAPITIPKHEPYVKEVYIRIIMDVLNEEEG